MSRRPTKHPFHWDVYSKLYDQLNAIAGSDDPRIHPEVARLLGEARTKLYQAWDLQAALERKEAPQG
jgi:hypothetical protein